ncbi:MAG: MarR family transcriptional regulator [Paracoccaceae bacterium]|nr:MarR family transcriptional regulator [Paracoccaceae bacterium]
MTSETDAHTVRTTSIGWMIQRIARRLDRAMETRLAQHDLSVSQFAVMMTVLETEGLTQAEIGQQFSMPAYAISRALDHLEKAGYVARRPHPTSRRAHTIHATPSGVALGPQLFKIVQEVNAALVGGLSEADKNTFRDILTRLV